MGKWWTGDLWVFSDNHYGHDAIRMHCDRPFQSVGEMDEYMLEQHNALVKPRDTWICVGDFAYKNHIKYKGRLNGKGIIVMGNHDKMSRTALAQFTRVVGGPREPGIMQTTINGYYCTFCHYPLWSWNASFHGSWCFYGHAHGRKREDIPHNILPEQEWADEMPPPRIFEAPMIMSCAVDVDVWGYKPVPWEVLELKMKSRIPAWEARMETLAKARDDLRKVKDYPALLAAQNGQWRAKGAKHSTKST